MSSLINYGGGNGGEMIRMNKIISELFINELNFTYLDTYEISKGKNDFFDGFHLMSISSRMSGMIFLNMVCYEDENWKEKKWVY